MIEAGEIHKARVIDILSDCFDTNRTVNWIVKQDSKRKERIRSLVDYSFETCLRSGKVLLTDDLNAVIMYSIPDNKLPILEEAYLTLQFVMNVAGIEGIGRAFKREGYIKEHHPQGEEDMMYVWFIGVEQHYQHTGLGATLVQEVIKQSVADQLPIYLETSIEQNVVFYKKFGFEVYHTSNEEVFGFELYFLRRLPDVVN